MKIRLLFLRVLAAVCLILAMPRIGLASPASLIFIQSDSLAIQDREAILILPGFGDSKSRRRKQMAFFQNQGYDVFIPAYRDRKSYQRTVDKLQEFVHHHDLGQYRRVHVFCYILGSWVFNDMMLQKPLSNVHRIVYDRSPLQERAPKVVAHRLKLPGRIKVGRMVEEFSTLPYPRLPQADIHIGLVVECKATLLIRVFRKYALSLGPLCWEASCFGQAYDRVHYTWLNHDQMYTHMEVIGPQVLHFFKHGSFSEEARGVPYQWDVFSPRITSHSQPAKS